MSDVPSAEAEVRRLRSLVGPSEDSYVRLAADLSDASAEVRRATEELGAERARVVELERELLRARRAAGRLAERERLAPAAYLRSLGSEAWTEVIRPRIARIRRRGR